MAEVVELGLELDLANTLINIEINETNYDVRYVLVLKAMYLAASLGYETGIHVDGESEDTIWWVSYIILPDIGEVSWHNPSKVTKYTGYDTNEKYKRCNLYTKRILRSGL